MTMFQNIPATSELDADDSGLWLVDGVVRRAPGTVTQSFMRSCPYVGAITGTAYTATRTSLVEDFLLTVDANTTITLAGGNVAGEVSVWNVTLVQDTTGGHSITVSGVRWVNGTPTFVTTAGASNHCSIVQHGTGVPYGYYGGSAAGVVLPPVTGYYDWWDATDNASMTLTGSRVDTWTSKGSQATVLTCAAGNPTIGTDSMNGLQCVDFDGVAYFTGSGYRVQPVTFVMAFIRHSDSAAHIIDGVGGSTRNLVGFSGSTAYQMYAGTVGTGSNPNANPHVRTTIFNGVSSSDWIDGVNVFSGDAGTQNMGNFYLGAGNGPSAGRFNGLIGEIIVYPSALGTTDRQSVEAYLTTRFL